MRILKKKKARIGLFYILFRLILGGLLRIWKKKKEELDHKKKKKKKKANSCFLFKILEKKNLRVDPINFLRKIIIFLRRYLFG